MTLGAVCDDRGMVPLRRIRSAGMALAAIVILAGCGDTHLLPGRHHGGGTQSAAGSSAKRPAATSSEVSVIKGWSDALRGGHLLAAAKFFHLPSVFANGATEIVEIRTLQDAEAVNASLPCGATYISAFQQGKLVDALFRLGSRQGPGGGSCAQDGSGDTTRVDFLIQDGKILHWLRAPSLPGDPGVPGNTGSGTQTSPGTGTGPQTGTGSGTSTSPGTGTGTGTNPTPPDGTGANV
jgi:hypothetical protein